MVAEVMLMEYRLTISGADRYHSRYKLLPLARAIGHEPELLASLASLEGVVDISVNQIH